jgi:hypothetical protein
MSEPVAFVVRRPQARRKYTLFLRQPGGMFGGGGNTIFAIDELAVVQVGDAPVAYFGRADGDTVVQFPIDQSYMLVSSDLTTPMTAQELASYQKQEREEWESAFGKPAGGAPSPEELAVAATVIPTGQYL